MLTHLCIKMKNIRNFSIIAHIDHGKSTLADRLLEFTGAITEREKQDQFLDKLELERERGITIKAQSVRLYYKAKDGQDYILNLIDTPGHVDFHYEVSRSLAACEGAILVVDSSQGIQAQTLANVYVEIKNNLKIFPVLNKIDLPAANPARVKKEIEEVIGLDTTYAVEASAKTGLGTEQILENIIKVFPPPQGNPDGPLQALIFDSWFDAYQGVVVLARLMHGTLRKGDMVLFMATDKKYTLDKLGVFSPYPVEIASLGPGEVGFFTAAIKDIHDIKIGDTVTLANNPCGQALPGFKEVKPMVFCGIYPTDSADYEDLRSSLEKLRLNDSSFQYEPETSLALGFGFRCGFLGLLHMEIIQERLKREYNLSLISTAPTVIYQVTKTGGEIVFVDTPIKLPPVQYIEKIEEPYITATIHLPSEYLGAILGLCEARRGIQREIKYITSIRVMVEYEIPLNEVVLDFYDRLKSLSKGYASMDYEYLDYREADLVKMDILLNSEPVDALSIIVPRERAYYRGKELVEKMKW